ncbi:MAG: hypothetical protein J6V09_04955 [Clostridia bacterium]|nr:hypothetical protein [Clostridia bacterium]
MIVLGIIDVRQIEPERVGDVSQNQLFLRAKAAQNTDEVRQKLGAYYLLSYLVREHMGADLLPEIYYTSFGKPYFKDSSELRFNISHDRCFAAVILSDGECEVGVDIQSMPDRKIRLERIRERFFAPLDYLSGKNDKNTKKINTHPVLPEFFSVKQTADGYAAEKMRDMTDIEIISGDDTAELEFLTKWTLLEATVKAMGEGMSAYRDSEKLDTDSYITAFKHNGNTFLLSAVAIKSESK